MHSWTAEWKKGKKIRYNNGQLVFAAFWYLRGVHGLLNFGQSNKKSIILLFASLYYRFQPLLLVDRSYTAPW